MDIEQIFNLTVELIETVDIAHKEAKNIKIDLGGEFSNFVLCDDKEYVHPKYLTFEQQREIIQLCQFVKMHKSITNEELSEILKGHVSKFNFLKEVVEAIPNFVEEARLHDDYKYMPYTYFNIKYFSGKETQLS